MVVRNSMNRSKMRLAEWDKEWRAGEFALSYPDVGDRGRMRGSSYHAPGTLHRSTCHHLSAAKREMAFTPASVGSTTLDEFRKLVNRSGVGNRYKICKVCCADVVVTGCNMMKP